VTVQLSPVLAGLETYPFVRLEAARARLRAAGVQIIDFGMGEPREETPAFIREALAAAIQPLAPYPTAAGLPELRAAIAGWAGRRFGVALDPDTEVIPTLGSKEAVFALANVFDGEVVAVPSPSYPVYERGAVFAGKRVLGLALEESRGWLPDLDAVDWTGVGVLWLNYPNNPTGARAPLEFYEHAAALAREHGFVLASDEAYSELYFAGEPPASALQVRDRSHVAVFNTLSKRSSMPGYRSGFVAGDPEIVAALKKYRPNVGVAPLEIVQRAAIAAWGDEAHVDAVRERYRAKRSALLPALEEAGLRDAGGDTTFFLWLDAGPGADELAARWLEAGVIVAPGSFFGAPGYLRVALVPSPEACARAADIIRSLA
jgi:succinyldiaminopimelate transaminase